MTGVRYEVVSSCDGEVQETAREPAANEGETAPLMTHITIKLPCDAADAPAPTCSTGPQSDDPCKAGSDGAAAVAKDGKSWQEGASGSGASPPHAAESGAADGCVCRICLEEDAPPNMQQPCACSGTQRYAHHACLQRWITEKGHLQCEICAQLYRGSYELPPPPPPRAEQPLQVPVGSLYLTIYDADHADGARDAGDANGGDETMHPMLSWCYSAMLFLLFVIVLHHSLFVGMPQPGFGPDGMPLPPDALDAANATTAAAAAAAAGMPGATVAPGAAVFMLWVLTKALLVAVPLLTVMRIASTPRDDDLWHDGGWDERSEDGDSPRGVAARRGGHRLVLTVRAAPDPEAALSSAAAAPPPPPPQQQQQQQQPRPAASRVTPAAAGLV